MFIPDTFWAKWSIPDENIDTPESKSASHDQKNRSSKRDQVILEVLRVSSCIHHEETILTWISQVLFSKIGILSSSTSWFPSSESSWVLSSWLFSSEVITLVDIDQVSCPLISSSFP